MAGLLLHATSGRWPTSSTVPDPLGDDYLQVRTDKGRFRIWSVGSDGIDGHGATRDEYKMGDSSDDLVAAYPPFPPYIPRPTQAPARYTKPD
ncbi:hypothetical protein EON82_09730 [bacterium]|nr:MAG: hypothetical protein EON82_09730 [bacterium]